MPGRHEDSRVKPNVETSKVIALALLIRLSLAAPASGLNILVIINGSAERFCPFTHDSPFFPCRLVVVRLLPASRDPGTMSLFKKGICSPRRTEIRHVLRSVTST